MRTIIALVIFALVISWLSAGAGDFAWAEKSAKEAVMAAFPRGSVVILTQASEPRGKGAWVVAGTFRMGHKRAIYQVRIEKICDAAEIACFKPASIVLGRA